GWRRSPIAAYSALWVSVEKLQHERPRLGNKVAEHYKNVSRNRRNVNLFLGILVTALNREVSAPIARCPPGHSRFRVRRAREVVIPKRGAEIAGRCLGKGVVLKQGQDFRRPLLEPIHQLAKPAILIVAAERCEPHLPIEPRHMQPGKTGRTRHIPGLPLEV